MEAWKISAQRMKRVDDSRRQRAVRFFLALLTALALFTTALPATAGMKTVWPDQLIPIDQQTADATLQFPDSISLTPALGSGQYIAPVKLPVGARITKLEYLHRDDTSRPGASTVVDLKRTRHMEGSPTTGWFHATRLSEGNSVSFLKISETEPEEGGRLVRPGYRHWVYVILNFSGVIGSIRIYYR